MLVSCHLNGGFVVTRLVNFPKFDEFLPNFLYGQILRRRKFQKRDLKYQELTENPIPKLGSDRYTYAHSYIHFTA